MTTRRTIVGLTAVSVLSLVLTGCSDDETPSGEETSPVPATSGPGDAAPGTEPPSSADEASTTAPPTEPTTESSLDPVVELDDEVGALADLRDFTCGVDEDGTWSASGVVTNPTEEAATYVVNIGVIESEGRSSVVRHNVLLDVSAGEQVSLEEADETVTDLLTSDRDDLECVVRVNRGSAE